MFCIPWLIVVLVRTGIITPQTIARQRRVAFVICLILGAAMTPGSDALSLFAMTLPMYALFEVGLLVSRFFVPPTAPVELPPDA